MHQSAQEIESIFCRRRAECKAKTAAARRAPDKKKNAGDEGDFGYDRHRLAHAYRVGNRGAAA
jgi:hypothetical protein